MVYVTHINKNVRVIGLYYNGESRELFIRHDLYTIMETQQPLTLQVQIYRVQSSQHIKTQHNNYYANDITMYYKANIIIYVIHNIFKCM